MLDIRANFVEDNGVVSDPGRVTEVFSDYFANIFQLGHRSDTDYTDHPSIRAIRKLRFSSEFHIYHIIYLSLPSDFRVAWCS